MRTKTDILSFTYSSRGRDIDIVEPVLSELESKYNLSIKRKWLYDNFVYDILKYKPKVLVLANAIGCTSHYYSCKFASMLGVKVVTFASEGDYRVIDNSLDTMLFGWNKDLKLFEDLHLEWSQKNIDLFKQHQGYDENKIKLSGATGFDKYKLLKMLSKEQFIQKYSLKPNSKIVGLGGWTFDFQFDPNHSTGPIFFGEELEGIKKSFYAVRDGYEYLVKNNPNIYFVAKLHPLTMDDKYDEFQNIYKYPNVLKFKTEENIYDLINVSDFWITFDSTTALEAWLLGKTTLLYNPIIKDFNRSSISEGSPIIQTETDLNASVGEFYNKGFIESFKNLESKRTQIIKDVIGFDDGRNYIRASKYIIDIMSTPKHIVKKDYLFIFKMISYLFAYLFRNFIYRHKLPLFENKRQAFAKVMEGLFDDKEREYYHELYLKAINGK